MSLEGPYAQVMLADDAVWVHLYGGSRLQAQVAGGRLALTQQTGYPWDGEITVTIREAPAEPFALYLRVPGWARGADLRAAGETVKAAPGAYAGVRRRWRAGDTVTLTLPLRAELVTAHPRLEQNRNQAAVVRGPVVYCLEQVDLDPGTPLDQVHLPRDFAPAARYRADLLGGVTVLEGAAVRAGGAAWNGGLYRRGEARNPEPASIRMIPYFAWHNRGDCAMAVWLPLA